MSVLSRLRTEPRAELDVDSLVSRVEAIERFVTAVDGRVPPERLTAARNLVAQADARLKLSRDHTVVALAGSTGSGKSSLFNALSGLELSRVGLLRPTTGAAHACVWNPGGAGRLLDWLGLPSRHQVARESALDGEEQAALRGLVLLDLPDFDSVEQSHRLEVDRLVGLVDLLIWVVDPQKYADKVVHERYLRNLTRHRAVTVVVLNQIDKLSPPDVERCLADLGRLLNADGLRGVPLLATSARTAHGMDELRDLLVETVAARRSALHRLSGDVATVASGLVDLVGVELSEDAIDRSSVRTLAGALSETAGVPGVAAAVEAAYRHRGTRFTGWPFTRWVRRLRPDPLRRLHLDRKKDGEPVPAIPARTSLPEATAAQRAEVGLAVRRLTDPVAESLPEPWAYAMRLAARSHEPDLPDALDRAVGSVDLGMDRVPPWWRVIGGLQWLFALMAVAGAGWLVARWLFLLLALPDVVTPRVGELPIPTLLLLGGLVLGLGTSMLSRPLVSIAARRRRRRAEAKLLTAITEVARDHVVAPLRAELHTYGDARAALAIANS